jgi:hypothetical protein
MFSLLVVLMIIAMERFYFGALEFLIVKSFPLAWL